MMREEEEEEEYEEIHKGLRAHPTNCVMGNHKTNGRC